MCPLMSPVHLIALRVIFVYLRDVRHLILEIVSSVIPDSVTFCGSETSSVRSLTAQELFNQSLTRRYGRPYSVFYILPALSPHGEGCLRNLSTPRVQLVSKLAVCLQAGSLSAQVISLPILRE